MRSFTLRRSVLIAGIVLALLVPATIASAGFLQSITASSSLRGMVDIAQGPAEADQHASPDDRKVLTATTDSGSGGTVATLYSEPQGDPGPGTASFPLTLQTTSGSASATAQLTIQRPEDAEGDDAWSALRIGAYVDGTPLLEGGIPLSPDQIAASGGIQLPPLEGDGKNPLHVEIRVWLAPGAPRDAYGVNLTMDLDILGETAAGERFKTEVRYS